MEDFYLGLLRTALGASVVHSILRSCSIFHFAVQEPRNPQRSPAFRYRTTFMAINLGLATTSLGLATWALVLTSISPGIPLLVSGLNLIFSMLGAVRVLHITSSRDCSRR